MSFKDELNKSRKQQISNYYTDEEVYKRLIDSLISSMKLSIKNYFDRNPSSNHYHSIQDIQWGFFYASYDEFRHRFKDDSPIYKKDDLISDNYRIFFRELHSITRKGNMVMVDLNPLGKRVLDDIKQMAQKEGIDISGPQVRYSVNYKTLFGKEKCDNVHTELGKSFTAHKGEKEYCNVFIEIDLEL